jgi:hypothetical protein
MRRYGLMPGAQAGGAAPPGGGAPPAPESTPTTEGGAGTIAKKPKAGSTNEVDTITVSYRAISLTNIKPDANKAIAYAVLNELKSSPYFDSEETVFSTEIGQDEPPGTFTFGISVKLKRPLKM